jgi:L,D-peptidoglycan transpeptidase YkuD (ErfK/YbiS/YcfS/YnhG family)
MKGAPGATMGRMRISTSRGRRSAPGRTAPAAAAAGAALALLLTGCGGDGGAGTEARPHGGDAGTPDAATGRQHIPGVGEGYRTQIPERTGQVVAVYGEGQDSARSRIELWTRESGKDGENRWSRAESWPGHNGKRGWTTDHREGDKRSPVGVFTLTDAGGVLSDPGTQLPYTHSAAFTPPAYWADRTEHDFDHVIAIDYNRVPGTSPLDPTRPRGQAEGGFIWLHVDHGSGTSGCVSVSREAMEDLLRTLDPDRRPVIVMGDRGTLGDRGTPGD